MKRTITILCILLLSLSGWAGKPVKKGQLASLVTEYRNVEGVELVRLGTLATSAIKTTIRVSAKDDPDSKQALRLLNGIRRLTIFEYEDCEASVKHEINNKLQRILRGSELLMEVKDESDTMQMYGIIDEDGESVRDFVLYTPADCALICIFGKVSMDAVAKIIKDND